MTTELKDTRGTGNFDGGATGPLELLIVQASPFCNINCAYCYLPDRQQTRVMADRVLDCLFRRVFESTMVRDGFTVAWHAGEPLTVPRRFYERALRVCKQHNTSNLDVRFNVQTNATLINAEWAAFFKENQFSIGVSIDGPAPIHDANRRYRSGGGTFAAAMRGIAVLKQFELTFDVIAVITRDSLPYAHEFIEFFRDLGARSVGLNIEEQEGVHRHPSVGSHEISSLLPGFLNHLAAAYSDGLGYGIREYDGLLRLLTSKPERACIRQQAASPFRIINVDADGNFSTFSPELLGHCTHLGKVHFGNVATNGFEEMLQHPVYMAVHDEIERGIAACRQECEYFELCGGGSPSNKFFENGRFDTTTTRACSANIKAVVDSFLNAMR